MEINSTQIQNEKRKCETNYIILVLIIALTFFNAENRVQFFC